MASSSIWGHARLPTPADTGGFPEPGFQGRNVELPTRLFFYCCEALPFFAPRDGCLHKTSDRESGFGFFVAIDRGMARSSYTDVVTTPVE
jgi:hypothetical protein